MLREDAALPPAGVSLAVDVDRVGRARGQIRQLRAQADARWRPSIGNRQHWPPARWGSGAPAAASGLTAMLREPATYRNPGVPDEQRASRGAGIALVGSVKSAAMVEVVARGQRVDEWARAFRAWVRSVLSTSVGPWSARSAAVATAILIGDRTGLAQDDEERLQEAGTYHVIAISGGNIAILTMLLLVRRRGGCGTSPRFELPPRCRSRAPCYGRVTGPAPSVDRAIAAAVLFLSGRLLRIARRGRSTCSPSRRRWASAGRLLRSLIPVSSSRLARRSAF